MRPDAVQFPEAWKKGKTARRRMLSVCDIADIALEVDGAAGERSYCRRLMNAPIMFCTRDPYDTLEFATIHPLAGHPRYDWEQGDDGIKRGYLTAVARAEGRHER
jgi:hypothetical protein